MKLAKQFNQTKRDARGRWPYAHTEKSDKEIEILKKRKKWENITFNCLKSLIKLEKVFVFFAFSILLKLLT